jgi:hypothetical protein
VRVLLDRGSRNVEQRAGEELAIEALERLHAARAAHARAAQEIHQHGFRLVVQMVRQRDDPCFQFTEYRVARFARGGFRPFAGFSHFDFMNRDGDVPGLAKPRAKPGPGIGVGAQPVMHMDGRNAGMVFEQVKQNHRVHASGERHGNALSPERFGELASARQLP